MHDSQANTTHRGLTNGLWCILGFWQEVSLLYIAKLTKFLEGSLKSKVDYQCRGGQGMTHLANSRIGVREY